MKQRLHLIILLYALLVVVACGSDKGERLQQLEMLEQMNRADSVMRNDSLAEDLVTYFDKHGTPNERMRAHYMLGRTYFDLGELPRALEIYLQAADCADTTASDCDYKTLSTKDGDDNDSTKGSMNQYGNLETLNPNFTFYINGNVTYSTQQSVYANIRITSNSKLTVNNILNMFGRVKITIESNGQLIIDGGVVTNADVNMMAGAKLTIKNGGKLVMQTGKDFVVPIYALLDIDEGEIIRSNQ